MTVFHKKPGQSCTVKVDKLSVRLGGETVFTGVGFDVHCGELLMIIGPNGAGKTTLLRAILGMCPHEGSVSFIDAETGAIARASIGYVPQRLDFDRLSPVTVQDLFATATARRPSWTGVGRSARERTNHMLEAVGCEQVIDRRLGALSGGELQRVLLALALCPLPRLLLLDEPVSGVDMKGLRAFYELVSELRRRHHLSIVMVSHDFAQVRRYADRVILLDKTVLRVGSPAEVLEGAEFQSCFAKEADDELPV